MLLAVVFFVVLRIFLVDAEMILREAFRAVSRIVLREAFRVMSRLLSIVHELLSSIVK